MDRFLPDELPVFGQHRRNDNVSFKIQSILNPPVGPTVENASGF
jgi:hypothetical protein